MYPDYEWINGLFRFTPRGSWGNQLEVRRYLNTLAESLLIKKEEDWYRVSTDQVDINYDRITNFYQLQKRKAIGFVSSFGSLYNALKFAYPHIDWDERKMSNIWKKSTQKYCGLNSI